MTAYHSSSSVFMTNNMRSEAKKRCKSTEPESWQTAKMFLFLSSSSPSDGVVQNCVTLMWFLHKTTAFYSEQCTSPSLFHNFEVSRASFKPVTEEL